MLTFARLFSVGYHLLAYDIFYILHKTNVCVCVCVCVCVRVRARARARVCMCV